ncbi:MAG: DUF1992 domain-containing protein [Proteobacteria bacterium]|nr:DUF1992 domain-containing protein [Pseudomonadota bacterium]
MAIQKIYDAVEAQIRDAIKRGDFDNLPNKGKPLDLSEWQKTPEHLRMSYSILKNAGYSPREVHTRKELANLKRALEEEPDKARKHRLLTRIQALEITSAVRMDKLRKR